MRTKIILSRVLEGIGVVLVVYACVLFVQNQLIEKNAQEYSLNVSEQMAKIMPENQEQTENFEIVFEEIQEISIEDDFYIGMLSIPSLDLDLPIQSSWSYSKLENTPCVYKYQPFSIAGHNYSAHFGKLDAINIDDVVIFTDVEGIEHLYSVVLVSVVYETDIDELEDNSYDLTLFTCDSQDNNYRILVRLNYLNVLD